VPAPGGSGSVGVTAASGCAWTATSNAAWITVTAGSAGDGNGTVAFAVAANSGAARTGTLTVAGQTFRVDQAAAPAACVYTLSAPGTSVNALGGSGSVDVVTTATCTWTAVSNAAWIAVLSGSSATGNGTVTFAVAPNLGAARTGTITVAGHTFTIDQAAVLPTCSYTLNPTSATFQRQGGANSVAVTAGALCAWTATSNVNWITITSGAIGLGNGTVGYTVASKPGNNLRTGTLTIAGQTFTVTHR